jgi:hypothetical protein
VNGTAKHEVNTGSKNTGHLGYLLNLGARTFYASLVDQKKILLPPLHVKSGIMKQFAEALPKTGNYFKYLHNIFPHLVEAKLK